MKKTEIFVVEHEREAQPDGKVFEKVAIDLHGKSTYHWQCICEPDEHDHKPIINAIAAGLSHRVAALPNIEALVGETVQSGDTKAVITDANIQIKGPANWPVYVAWKYDNGRSEHRSFEIDTPLKTPKPEAVLSLIRDAVKEADRKAAAAKANATFEGEVSSDDPAI